MPEVKKVKIPDIKKRRRERLLICLVIVAVVVVFIILLNTVFRAIDITVENSTPYSTTELLSASGIKSGKPLLSIKEKNIEKTLLKKFPYLEDVSVDIKFPNDLNIVFKGSNAEFQIKTEKGYAIFNKHLKLLEYRENSSKELIDVLGLEFNGEVEIGEMFDDQYRKTDILESYFDAAIESGLADMITEFSLEKYYGIYMIINDVITVDLGSAENPERKIASVKAVLDRHDFITPATVNARNYNKVKYRTISE